MRTTNNRLIIVMLGLVLAACATAQGDSGDVMAQLRAKPIDNKPHGEEDRDWAVAETDNFKIEPYHHITPTTHPNAQTITTFALREMVLSADKPVVINVLGTAGKAEETDGIPESVWLAGAGVANLDETKSQQFANALQTLTAGDKSKPLIFYCLDTRCWLSYNAALRAARLGYNNIYWYRGGIYSWYKAGLPIVKQSVTYNFL